MWRPSRSHRARKRAHTVLLDAKSYSLDQIADVLELDHDAVLRTLDKILERLHLRLNEERRLDYALCSIDATSVRASRAAAGA